MFVDKNASTPARWDCGEMDTICGFYNVKMWIKERLAKSRNINPQFSLCCDNGKFLLLSFLATLQELEVLLTNKKEKCHQISKSNSHVQFGVGIHFSRCQS
jgi:hypothetical protein